MKIQPLSTHPYAEGGSGEVLESSHHLQRSKGRGGSNTTPPNGGWRRPRFKRPKTHNWNHKISPYCLSVVIQVSWSPDIKSCLEKPHLNSVFSLIVACSSDCLSGHRVHMCVLAFTGLALAGWCSLDPNVYHLQSLGCLQRPDFFTAYSEDM